ncbi:P-loop containing nucleoside triphosphate hydrolase protein [Teratosphaeria nubilosa]|uniref:P-loop containing nucleoside triphosphate hydrolase protein n=1 Tax=Teratosphaeria nubilosa TaxID=161662 RepID=A0A6G1L627_9PEZI|nr:P-loop containing nucleoside triphosphate hydrolase protein [Teratosphaeria nubilosa]
MLAGRLGPPEMTVGVLKSRLQAAVKQDGVTTFVLDGFPRALKPAQLFEEHVAPIYRVLVLDYAEETTTARLEARARFDDVAGAANLAERMRTYREDTAQVIEAFEALDKVVHIDADRDVEAVWWDVRKAVADLLGEHAPPCEL